MHDFERSGMQTPISPYASTILQNIFECLMEFAFQVYLKLGQSKEDKLRRVTLQIDISDIIFAFKVRTEFLTPVSIPMSVCFWCTN